MSLELQQLNNECGGRVISFNNRFRENKRSTGGRNVEKKIKESVTKIQCRKTQKRFEEKRTIL